MPRKSNFMTFKKNNLYYSTSATEQDSSLIEKKLISKISYKNIIHIENLTKGLEKTKSNVSPGIDGETKANFTDKKLQILHKSLKHQNYAPSPVKKVNIPKPNGGIRTLGIASQQDKIIQAAILLQLEPVLGKIFFKNSYGSRPSLNCHHALKEIKKKWQNITWIISIDIQKYFDNINHDLLLKLLENYCDQATIELIRKLIKCGYVNLYNNPNHMEPTITGISQGSIISPILSNLYLHQLDQYIVDTLLPLWNRGDSRKFISGYQNRKKLTAEEKEVVEKLNLKGLTEAIARLKHNEWINKGLPARDPNDENFRRLHYLRYIDDFLLGFTGTKAEAEEIKNNIENFLSEKLLLKTNQTKSFISHSSDYGIRFLGFYIRYIDSNKIVKDPKIPENDGKGLGHQLKSTAINSVQLRIPTELILKRAVDRGYGKIRKAGSIRASSCRKLSSFDDKLIVQRFSNIIRGLINYYSPANSLSDLWPIVAFYRKSCALTLADKHKLKTAAKAFKRYGPKLKITDPIKLNETVLFYPTSLKTTGNFKLTKVNITLSTDVLDPIQGSYRSNPKTSTSCQYPNCDRTDNLQEHHINPVRNIKNMKKSKLQVWMQKNLRRTVTLCNDHHVEIEKLYRSK